MKLFKKLLAFTVVGILSFVTWSVSFGRHGDAATVVKSSYIVCGVCMRFVKGVPLALLSIGFLVSFFYGANSSGAAMRGLAAPTYVHVTTEVGGVVVSWHGDAASGVHYTVSSSPFGKGCSTVATECFVPVTDSTPWRFFVTASTDTLSSFPSKLSASYLHHILLIVAGQSNANGWESYATDPLTGINYMAAPFTNGADSYDKITWESWDVLPQRKTGMVALDSPQNIGSIKKPVIIFGPEVGLARQLYADKGLKVNIIKAAWPGTSLEWNWLPTTAPYNVANGTGLFSGMVELVLNTMARDASHGILDTIGGFYWYQGEADSTSSGTADLYQTNLTSLITGVRSGIPMSPRTPVGLVKMDMTDWNSAMLATNVFTQSQYEYAMEGNAKVRAADDWAVENIPGVVEVDSAGLPRHNGLIHLTNQSELSIGESLARASENQIP